MSLNLRNEFYSARKLLQSNSLKLRFPLLSLSIYALSFFPSHSCAQSPIASHLYTADPSVRVFNDTLYVYSSHDLEEAQWFNMRDYHVLSSPDLQTWTDHGLAFTIDSIKWATKWAWAPDCVAKNNRYYFYFPVQKDFIGVAVGNHPAGPFIDTLKKPLISRATPGVIANRGLIDPAVFIDEDSAAYLLFGQNHINIVKLNPDMLSFSDTVKQIKGAKHFFEAVWLHKYNNKYYLSYSGKPKLALRAKIRYAVGDSPYGPFQYKGVILGKVNSGTNHASISLFKNQWYLFYHTADLFFKNHPDASLTTIKKWYRRSVCFQPLTHLANGDIERIHHPKKNKSYLPADSQ